MKALWLQLPLLETSMIMMFSDVNIHIGIGLFVQWQCICPSWEQGQHNMNILSITLFLSEEYSVSGDTSGFPIVMIE